MILTSHALINQSVRFMELNVHDVISIYFHQLVSHCGLEILLSHL